MCEFTLFVEAMARAWLWCLRNLSAENLSHLSVIKGSEPQPQVEHNISIMLEYNISIIKYHNSFPPSSISRRASTPHKCDSVRFAHALGIPPKLTDDKGRSAGFLLPCAQLVLFIPNYQIC
jgi:hypothetical protein